MLRNFYVFTLLLFTAATVNAQTNRLPVVSLTAPSFISNTFDNVTFTLTANASDPDGSIARVEFYAGTTLVGTDATAPFAVEFVNPTKGTHSITAVATDNRGGKTTSRATTLNVRSGLDLAVATFVQPSTSATTTFITPVVALRNVGNVAVTSATVTLQMDNGAVETVNWTGNLAPNNQANVTFSRLRNENGAHVLVANITGVNGNIDGETSNNTRTLNFVSNIINAAPQVRMASPSFRSTAFEGTNFTFSATASDRDGWVEKVEFFAGTTLLGTVNSAPFNLTLNNVPVGTHSITARAYDDRGSVTVSNTTTLVINPSLNVRLTTVLQPTSSATAANITPSVVLGNLGNTVITSATVSYQVDGGAVQTVNWTGTLEPNRTANVSFPAYRNENGNHIFVATVSNPNGRADGDNSNNSFTRAYVSNINNAAPQVRMSSPSFRSSIAHDSAFTLTATASDRDGWITRVEFYAGSTLVGTDTEAPYSVTLNTWTAGTYAITAKAFDDRNASTTSGATTLVVNNRIDLRISDLTGFDNTIYEFYVAPRFKLTNLGAATARTIVVAYSVDGGAETRVTYNIALTSGREFACGLETNSSTTNPYISGLTYGTHEISMRIVSVNGENDPITANNVVTRTINYTEDCPPAGVSTYNGINSIYNVVTTPSYNLFIPLNTTLKSKLSSQYEKEIYFFKTTNASPNARVKVNIPYRNGQVKITLFRLNGGYGNRARIVQVWNDPNQEFVYNLNATSGDTYILEIESASRFVEVVRGMGTVLGGGFTTTDTECFTFAVETQEAPYGFNSANGYTTEKTQDYNLTSVYLAPNPATDYTTINVVAKESGDYNLFITDMAGKLVRSQAIKLNEGENRMELDVQDMPHGMYFVRLNRGSLNVIQKLVVGK